MRCAWVGGGAPWILIKAQICQEFGWTLSQLDEENIVDVLQMFSALSLFSEYQHKHNEASSRVHAAAAKARH